MNTPTPATVASARTARLVRESQTPVYTSETPKREHLMVIEWEADTGGRYWTRPMPESKAEAELAEKDLYGFYSVSDYDHSSKCWCQK